MKIVYMLHDGLNYNGGPAINAVRLLPELQKRGHSITAIALYFDFPTNAKHLEENGIPTITKQYSEYSEDLVQWIVQTVKHIAPDVFIPNTSFQGGFAARWVRESGIPTVIAHRGDNALNWSLVKTFAGGKKRWQVSGLLCVSESLRRKASSIIAKEVKTKVIPSGVPASSHQSLQQGETLRVVYAGRLEQRQKRVQDLLTSFIWVLSQNREIEFTIVGDGKEKEFLEKEIRKHRLTDKIRLTGRLLGKSYQEELSSHHVIVLMSDYEGIPGSLMDGMACGLVPISLQTDGIDELVIHQQTGWLIDNRKDSFLSALNTLRNQSLRKQLSKNAINHIHRAFSLEMATDRWESFCQELVEESPGKTFIQVPNRLILPLNTLSYEGTNRKYKPLGYWIKQGSVRGKRKLQRLKLLINRITP